MVYHPIFSDVPIINSSIMSECDYSIVTTMAIAMPLLFLFLLLLSL